MTTRTAQKERTHQDILGSAVRLLRERGIRGTSVADVMRGAGLTVGGFYAHFASKEALVGECLRRALRQTWDALLQTAGEAREGALLEVLLERYLSGTHRDTPAQGCVLPAVVGEVADAGPVVQEALAAEVASCAEALAARLDGAPPEARQRALGTLALLYGGLSLARALRGTALSEEILQSCRAQARAAFRGFTPKESR